jgi:hypothetical protein
MSDGFSKQSDEMDLPGSRRRERGQNRIWWGLVLIFLGVLFLLQRMGITTFNNWWAIFILLPAFSSFAAAIELYRRQGRISYAVRNSLVGGLFPLAVAVLFLLGLSWAVYWPVFVILGGLAMFSNGLKFENNETDSKRSLEAMYHPWAIMTGLGAMALGSGFLLKNLGIFDPSLVVKNWWGIAILFPAAGGLISTFLVYQERKRFDWLVLSNLAIAICAAIPGLVAVMGLNWNFVGPLIIIVIGLALLLGFRQPGKD